jgi:histidinol dehydrogenase
LKIIEFSKLEKGFFEYKELTGESTVLPIISDVIKYGDEAVKNYTKKFDGVEVADLIVSKEDINQAHAQCDPKTITTIKAAVAHIRDFSQKQLSQYKNFEYEITPGTFVGQKIIPLDRVGVYVPGGRYPLVSTVLMGVVPAQVAGVKEIIICSPPRHQGAIHPAILAAAKILDIGEIYGIGGVQAIAAMAYGTQTIRKVDKIVGPGNKYVTAAKKEVFGRVGIDFIAGPTEIIIVADDIADPAILAADLIAQAEHDKSALPILITDSVDLAKEVNKQLENQLKDLKTKDVAIESLEKNGRIIITKEFNEIIDLVNRKAPEHLELQVKDPKVYIERLNHYGSLFIGVYSAEALGDYSSGVNHTLPTNGCARYTGGLGVKDFIKIPTTVQVTRQGLSKIGPIAQHLGEIEGLDGHARSVSIRLNRL